MATGTRGRVDAQRVVWTVVVAAFLALAVAAPVELFQFRSELNDARGEAGAGESQARVSQARVSMVSLTFQPEVLAVRKGTEVIFENNDVAPHTVTDAAGTAFDSGTLNSRKIFKLVVQDTIEYVCLIHPSMRGKIILSG
ncbi:MAG: cupredoxin domain-containing protein [Acidimicrobiales bacterium]